MEPLPWVSEVSTTSRQTKWPQYRFICHSAYETNLWTNIDKDKSGWHWNFRQVPELHRLLEADEGGNRAGHFAELSDEDVHRLCVLGQLLHEVHVLGVLK